MGWTHLHPVQVETILAYFSSTDHLVVIAETAGGKTEAAFLPVLSSISTELPGSVRAIYVGPLKALINDQFERLENLCSHLELPVHRWHGDVGTASKTALVRDPGGVLLITPESIESLLINRTPHLSNIFGGLRAVVVDELHAFLDNERGLHLSSLLSRLFRYVDPGQPQPRVIGLSATIGEPEAAQRYIQPDAPHQVLVINPDSPKPALMLRVHGYRAGSPVDDIEDALTSDKGARSHTDTSGAKDSPEAEDEETRMLRRIAADLVTHCANASNLIFANAKGDIELCADLANEISREQGRRESFLVHHGSLSKELREDVETRMKSEKQLSTICSSTLEMGIDIGSVRMVGQIGAPWSVSSLRQRMGRSGRRDNESRRLRIFIREHLEDEACSPVERLPFELLRTIAACELMLGGWCEPASPSQCDLSTLTHQIISTIAERGAATASDLHRRLCVDGPFRAIQPQVFAQLLRQLGSHDIVEQGPDGAIILGLQGERIRKQKDFYAAFATPEEYALLHEGHALGSLPLKVLPAEGDSLVFAGRRWQVINIEPQRRIILVKPSRRRQRPKFTGGLGETHGRVREMMRQALATDTNYSYLDDEARSMLADARVLARDHDLAGRRAIAIHDSRSVLLPWSSCAVHRTLSAWLRLKGVSVHNEQDFLICETSAAHTSKVLKSLSSAPVLPASLAPHLDQAFQRKFDEYLGDSLLTNAAGIDLLDIPDACRFASLI